MTVIAGGGSTLSRVLEHRWLVYRRTFRASLFSSFLTPVLFLAAIGFGLGMYVDSSATATLGVSYIDFLAPGLLAATCMQTAAFEATFPIMAGLLWNRNFHAMHATPITSRDITLGNLAWIGVRLLLVAAVFAGVMVLFGAFESPLVVLAIPAGALTGLAFAAPIAAFSATQRTVDKFNAIFRFGVTPLFLFSGTFFPIDTLPALLRPIAWLTPLDHGVDLTRGLSLGTIGEAPLLAVVHLLVLVGFIVVGTVLALRTIGARLVRG
jgi:lipooligosaccharide transport system permease protein